MATQTRNPTSEVSVTGTWSGTDRHLLLDDHPDSGNPINDGTTCSAAGVAVYGFTPFTVPANATAISVQVIYYDFKNGSQACTIGAAIRCNDTTNRLSGTHNPGNGNANIALRTDNYANNPKTGAAWTVDDVNGVGTNGLTAFGQSVTDASPTITVSSTILQVTYTPNNQAFVSFGELEVPDVQHRLYVSFAELETPDVQHRLYLSFGEFEVPDVASSDRRGQVSFGEFEVPDVAPEPRRLYASFSEFEVPDVQHRCQISFAELEVPEFNKRCHLSWTEFEVPNVGGGIGRPSSTRRGWIWRRRGFVSFFGF